MELNEGDDDDFFGSQSEGVGANSSQGYAEMTNFANPQQPAGIMNALDTLAFHERRAEEQKLSTFRYLEALDEFKEVTVQEGIEVGYRNAFSAALELGRRSGILCMEQELCRGTANPPSSVLNSLNEFLIEYKDPPSVESDQ